MDLLTEIYQLLLMFGIISPEASQQTLTYSKSVIATQEKGVKYVQN